MKKSSLKMKVLSVAHFWFQHSLLWRKAYWLLSFGRYSVPTLIGFVDEFSSTVLPYVIIKRSFYFRDHSHFKNYLQFFSRNKVWFSLWSTKWKRLTKNCCKEMHTNGLAFPFRNFLSEFCENVLKLFEKWNIKLYFRLRFYFWSAWSLIEDYFCPVLCSYNS